MLEIFDVSILFRCAKVIKIVEYRKCLHYFFCKKSDGLYIVVQNMAKVAYKPWSAAVINAKSYFKGSSGDHERNMLVSSVHVFQSACLLLSNGAASWHTCVSIMA